jgi:hypothetical protein
VEATYLAVLIATFLTIAGVSAYLVAKLFAAQR